MRFRLRGRVELRFRCGRMWWGSEGPIRGIVRDRYTSALVVPINRLHNHSTHSLLDNSLSLDGLSEAVVQFHKKAQVAGLHAVIGSEVHVGENRATVGLLVENATGYRNLCRLLDDAEDQPSAGADQSAQHRPSRSSRCASFFRRRQRVHTPFERRGLALRVRQHQRHERR